MGLRMTDEQMGRNHPAPMPPVSAPPVRQSLLPCRARAHPAAVFNAGSLQLRAWIDRAFVAHAGRASLACPSPARTGGNVSHPAESRSPECRCIEPWPPSEPVETFITLPSISAPAGIRTWPPCKTSDATRVRKMSPSWLSVVERRSSRRTRIVVPSPSCPGPRDAGCTMSPSGS